MEFLDQFNHGSLFIQNWGFYCPNPSVTHGWYKVVGVKSNGEKVDLKNKCKLSMDKNGLDNYRNYSWLVFYYKTGLYGFDFSRVILDNWAEYEFKQVSLSQTEEDFVQVQIIDFRQTIISPSETEEIKSGVLSYFPN